METNLSPYFESLFGGYNTDQFNASDPRNVAPGNNSVTVTGQISAWQQIQDATRKNSTAIYWAAAGLVTLAILKGRR